MNRNLPIVGRISAQFLRKKSSSEIRSRDVKARNKENKQLFGPLVETQNQKRVRLKVGRTIPEAKNDKDSEIKWLVSREGFEKTTKAMRLPKNPVDYDSLFFSSFAVKRVDPQNNNNDNNNNNSNNNNNNNNNKKKCYKTKILCPEKGSTGSRGKDPGEFEAFQVRVGQNCFGKDSDKDKKFDGKFENLFKVSILGEKYCKGSENGSSGEVLSYSASEDSGSTRYPSVTRILNVSMSEEAKLCLENWKKRMIETLGEDGFVRYQNELLSQGKLLHSTIQGVLLKKSVEIPESVRPSFESVRNVLKDVDYVKATETHVVHPELRYRGFIDCIASYRGQLCLIDWKKSDRIKSSIVDTYDAPIQIAAYVGALNSNENYPFTINKGLLVVGYSNGEEATIHELPLQKLQVYWSVWLKRLQKYLTEQQQQQQQDLDGSASP